jgi:putative Ca2+/H+ antiporter (TMEM165/GDT1 family)
VTEFLVVVAAAFAAQLAVLPGEKVQFLISALSTEYSPVVVVSAAGVAFAGWTALEIAFADALRGAIPPLSVGGSVVLTGPEVLDGLTAVLFLLFAYLLYRSMPAPDESTFETAEAGDLKTDGAGFSRVEQFSLPVVGEVPRRFGGFVPIFSMMAAGEFGDKTQLVTISLAVQYGAHPGIWAGEMLAIIPVSIANAVFFHRFAGRFDARKAHLFGVAVFLFFGLDTVLALATGVSVWETAVGTASSMLLSLV